MKRGFNLKANNSKTNKVLNRNFILKMFILNSPVSRIQLSKYSGLSKMSLTNIAESGVFASDRSIEDYARDIWHVKPVE